MKWFIFLIFIAQAIPGNGTFRVILDTIKTMLTQVLAKLETSQTDREALMLVFIKQLLAERLALQKRITELENDTRDRISDDDVKTIERISAREVQSFADIASMQRNTFPTVLN